MIGRNTFDNPILHGNTIVIQILKNKKINHLIEKIINDIQIETNPRYDKNFIR